MGCMTLPKAGAEGRGTATRSHAVSRHMQPLTRLGENFIISRARATARKGHRVEFRVGANAQIVLRLAAPQPAQGRVPPQPASPATAAAAAAGGVNNGGAQGREGVAPCCASRRRCSACRIGVSTGIYGLVGRRLEACGWACALI